MLLNDFILLNEGRYDPFIFKAIFICGLPGSGKNTILRQLNLMNLGFKLVDVDEVLMKLKNLHFDYNRGGDISLRRQNIWIRNFLGLAIATTGRLAEKTIQIDRELRKVGYQTMMVYVDIDKEIAIKRIQNRAERTVDLNYFNIAYEQLRENLSIYKLLFNENLTIVENSNDFDVYVLKKKVREFLSRPITDKAKQMLNQNPK